MTKQEDKLSKSKQELDRKPEEHKDYIKSIDPIKPWPRRKK